MTLEANVLGPDAVRTRPDGYEVHVHLAWYRSLPLSCLEDVVLEIDGERIAREDVIVAYDGQELGLDQIADLIDEWWFVQDPISLRVPHHSPRAVGERADVEVTLATRIPYILIGPDAALVQRTNVSRKVVVR